MLNFSNTPLIMGILNYTNNSFSDGGLYNNPSTAIDHALLMERDGADIIDFGACSTKPGCKYADEKTELSAIVNIIPILKNKLKIPISVDTFYVRNQIRSIEIGADIINDVGGIYNEDTAYAVKNSNVFWVIMHGGVLTDNSSNENIIQSVQLFFDEVYERALYDKIEDKIILDPGFGFNKTTIQNKNLLNQLNILNTHGMPLLCALSRKRFVGELSDDNEINNRIGGTIAGNIIAIQKGASLIRVHDVYQHKKALSFLHNIS